MGSGRRLIRLVRVRLSPAARWSWAMVAAVAACGEPFRQGAGLPKQSSKMRLPSASRFRDY